MVCGREETEELYGGQQPAISRHSLAGDAPHACSRTTHGGHPSQVPPLSQHQAPTKFAATLQVSHSASACGHTGSSSVLSHVRRRSDAVQLKSLMHLLEAPMSRPRLAR